MYRWVRERHMIGIRGRNFMEAPWAGGIVLLGCVIIAMLLANLPATSLYYRHLLETDLSLMVHSPDGVIDWIFPRGMTVEKFINDILMISRLESMDAEVMFSDVRISVLLQEIMDSLKPLAASCQVFLHVDVKPLCIRANLQQMKELFTNLATNAIKYNRPGGQVWITVGEQGDDMLVRVKDNGVGIPKESLDRIFERFYRADASRGEQSGFGLGLPIAASIATEHKGTLKAESDQASTRFLFSMPLKK